MTRSGPPTMRRAAWRSRARRTAPWFMPMNRPPDGAAWRTPGSARRAICIFRSCCARMCPRRACAELSFVAALAVADTVEALLPRQTRAMLKWPNDVLVSGGKIAGILLEQVERRRHYRHRPECAASAFERGLQDHDDRRQRRYRVGGRRARHPAGTAGAALAVWQADGFVPIRERWLERSYPIGAAIRANAGGQAVRRAFRRVG